MVFGKQWDRIQLAPAINLKGKRHILIAGGGSGKLLEGLDNACNVTFLDLSKMMIMKARLRRSVSINTFIRADLLKWESTKVYDAIVFPFFLDSFQEQNLQLILSKTKGMLKDSGELHVIDFQTIGAARNFLVKLMYIFFRILTKMEGKRLLDINGEIQKAGLSSISESLYYNGWIYYRVYR